MPGEGPGGALSLGQGRSQRAARPAQGSRVGCRRGRRGRVRRVPVVIRSRHSHQRWSQGPVDWHRGCDRGCRGRFVHVRGPQRRHDGQSRRQSRHAHHRGPSLRQHEPRSGPGVLFRRHFRGASESACQDPRAARGGAHVLVLIQGTGRRGPGDCEAAECGLRAGRLRAQGRQPGARHRSTHQGGRRLPRVVGDVRPHARRHLRHPGRDRRRRREAAPDHVAWQRALDAQDGPRGLSLYLQSVQLVAPEHQGGVREVRRAAPQGAGDRRRLRSGLGRAGRQLRQQDGVRPDAAGGGLCPRPRGQHAGTRDRPAVCPRARRTGLHRDVRRERLCRGGKAPGARVCAGSGEWPRAWQQRHAAQPSRPEGARPSPCGKPSPSAIP